MKIVDLKTFLAMPEGTVFSKYEPYFLGDTCIKGDSRQFGMSDGFEYLDLTACPMSSSSSEVFDTLQAAEVSGTSSELDFESYVRDWLFEQKQLFAIWEHADVEEALIATLTKTLTVG